MDENRLIELLKDGTNLKTIEEERERLLHAFESNDETIEAVSLKMKELKHDVPSKTNQTTDAVFKALEQTRICKERENRLLIQALDELNHRSEEINILAHAIRHLPLKNKRVIVGLFVEEKTWEEMAGELGVGQTTIQRIRKKTLQKVLDHVNVNMDMDGYKWT